MRRYLSRAMSWSGYLLVGLWCMPAAADVSLGEWIVRKGNTIEVVGPDASVDLQQLIDDIQDASATNRYQIKLGPGVYEIGSNDILVMKEFVDLSGSGQETTEILGANVSGGGGCGSLAGHGVLAAVDNFVLSDLTVTGNSTVNSTGYVLCNKDSGSPTFRNVTAKAISDSNGGSRFAVRLEGGNPQLIDVTAIVDGGSAAYALYCLNSLPSVSRAWLTAKNAVSVNRGIWAVGTCSIDAYNLQILAEEAPTNVGIEIQTGTDITLRDGFVHATGSGANRGLKATGDGRAVLHGVRFRTNDGSTNTGIELLDDATLRFRRGTAGGTTASIDTDSTVTARISQSTLTSAVAGTGTVNCIASDDGMENELDSTCSP